MVLLEDTRQQIYAGNKHKNIHDHCDRAGITINRTTLPFGDYALAEDVLTADVTYTDRTGTERTVKRTSIRPGGISVDTKKDIVEISGNLLHTQDHERFRRECIKAQEAGCQLIVLIEEIPPCGMVDLWVSPVFQHSNGFHTAGQPVTRINPVLLRKCMKTMEQKYGVRFMFCDRSQTGRVLIDILTGRYKI